MHMIHMRVSINRGSPLIMDFNGIFHYKPSIFGYPPFIENPIWWCYDDITNVVYYHASNPKKQYISCIQFAWPGQRRIRRIRRIPRIQWPRWQGSGPPGAIHWLSRLRRPGHITRMARPIGWTIPSRRTSPWPLGAPREKAQWLVVVYDSKNYGIWYSGYNMI